MATLLVSVFLLVLQSAAFRSHPFDEDEDDDPDAFWNGQRLPRPDSPGEALAFRNRQWADENGRYRPEALLEGRAHARRMPREPRSIGQVEPAAGVNQGSWTWLGPGNIGGRVRSLVIDPGNANTMFAGSVGGGIFKTTTGGASWAPVNDFMANLAVSALVMQPGTPATIYAGTGEGFHNADGLRGAGVFKSTDGGTTFNQLPSTSGSQWYYVNRLAMSPPAGATILAATRSGVFRSTDGGATWSNRLVIDATDVEFHPTDGLKAVASSYVGNAYYTIDGGVTWTAATGLSGARVEIAYARSSPTIVYASVDLNNGTIYKSVDGGASYSFVSNPQKLSTQGWYANALWVDPTNPTTLIVGGLDLWKSTNGGANFSQISRWQSSPSSAHADHHGIFEHPGFNGSTNKTVFFTNDGGLYKASNVYTVGGNMSPFTSGWSSLNNSLGITQFYGAGGHPGTGLILGGTQDNGTLKYTVAGGTTWTTEFGGDGGYSAVDQTNANNLYGEYVYLQLHRSRNGGSVTDWIYGINGGACKATPYAITEVCNYAIGIGSPQANFIAPFVLDPNNQNRLLAGAASLWRSDDVTTPNTSSTGPSWTAIKPPSTSGNFISAVAVAKGNSDIIFVGHNNGALFKTTSGTAPAPVWTQVGSGVLPSRMVLRVRVDPTDTGIVYAAYGGFNANNLWKSTDGGTTWAVATGSGATALPAVPVRDVAINQFVPGWLYAATEIGVFTSQDGGGTWTVPQDGPSNVSVDELFWMNTTLVAATHGRGLFKATPTALSTVSFTTGAVSTAEAAGTLTATVALITSDGGPSASQVSVNYSTASGTATAGSDFTAASGTLTWAAGTASGTTRTLQVVIANDAVNEPTETFNIGLFGESGAILGVGVQTVSIVDDDPVPSLSINDLSAAEGNSGTTSFPFAATLSAASGRTVTVNYATAAGTATAAGNVSAPFTNPSTITMPSSGAVTTSTPYPSPITVSGVVGTPTKITVTLTNVTRTQFSQDMDILLVSPSLQKMILMSDAGASTGMASQTLTFDDDAAASLPFATAIVTGTYKPTNFDDSDPQGGDVFPSPAPAGPYGSTLATLLSGDPNGTWNLYVVDDFPGTDGATIGGWTLSITTPAAGGDYLSTAGTLTFAPGITTQPITVTVNGDATIEPDETFFVNLTSPANATLSKSQGVGTIVNDDGAPVPAIGLNATTFAAGATITATITNGPGTAGDWVGLFKTTDTDSIYQDWKYLGSGTRTKPASGVTGGSVSFTAPATAGSYDVRFFLNDSTQKLATSATITVTSSTTIGLSATNLTPGATLTATIAGGPGTAGDWVGLFKTTDTDSIYQDWKYLGSGTKTKPASGVTGGDVTFTVPPAPGTYNVRFFQNDSLVKLATSATITVASVAAIGLSATTLNPGDTETATISNGPGNAGDWVGLFKTTDSDAIYVDWKYLGSGTRTKGAAVTGGPVSFTMPATAGTYDVRFFQNDSLVKLATSATITVTGTAPTVSVNTTTVTPGGTVTATIANGPGNAGDWVGVFKTADSDSIYQDWKYLNGTKTRPPTGVTGAIVNFTMPLTRGTYNVRFFLNDSLVKLATSLTITVQ